MEQKSLYFSCSYNNNKEGVSDIHISNSADMITLLSYLERTVGHASLEYYPEPEIGIARLTVNSDSEKYLLTLVEYDKDGEYLIRTSNEYEYSDKLVYFEGELFPPSAVIKNFEIVKKAFVELLETGQVSHDLMS